ncbi:MAG TPA: HAMP domain-containing sensor histidine kinase [Actinocatenispora sp.]
MLLYGVPFFAIGAVLLLLPLLTVGNTNDADGGDWLTPPPGVYVHLQVVFAAVGLVVIALLALTLGWLVAGRYLRPLRAITATARDISATNLDRRLRLADRDEFGELAATLDDLFGRLRASFDSQRHFVANASHELRTPLTAERTLLQLAIDDPDATVDTLRDTCRELLGLNVQQERLVDALLTLATGEEGIQRAEPLDLADVVDGVVRTRAQDARRRDVHLNTDLTAAPAMGDRPLLSSLVANLVDNALRYNEPGGRIDLTTTIDETRAHLTVGNTGPTIPPYELDRLFQPFQRLDRNRIQHADGHGLGLAIVRAIADAHNASITPTPRPGGGLDIMISFPTNGHHPSAGPRTRHDP